MAQIEVSIWHLVVYQKIVKGSDRLGRDRTVTSIDQIQCLTTTLHLVSYPYRARVLYKLSMGAFWEEGLGHES